MLLARPQNLLNSGRFRTLIKGRDGMSGYAWLGVLLSASVSTLALASYLVMAVPYFDNLPYLQELRRHTGYALLIGMVIFSLFFVVFLLGALFLDQDTSGPLLIFAGLVFALPVSLLLGTETWDRHNAHGMNKVPALRAVAVATGIGLAELSAFALVFMALL